MPDYQKKIDEALDATREDLLRQDLAADQVDEVDEVEEDEEYEDELDENEDIDQAQSQEISDAMKMLELSMGDTNFKEIMGQFSNMFNTEDGEKLTSNMLQSLNDGNLNMEQFMEQMMQDITSKEYLYEPFKDLCTRLPEYIESNRETISDTDLHNYTQQIACYTEILAAFDKEPEDTETVMRKLEELQNYGAPPKELLSEADQAALNSISSMEEQNPEQLPGMNNQGCAQQ
uniref:Peroxin-19 n=3 Tax=Lygus hesperus TaxID=30085 RepID=A0A146LHR5_LYGHE